MNQKHGWCFLKTLFFVTTRNGSYLVLLLPLEALRLLRVLSRPRSFSPDSFVAALSFDRSFDFSSDLSLRLVGEGALKEQIAEGIVWYRKPQKNGKPHPDKELKGNMKRWTSNLTQDHPNCRVKALGKSGLFRKENILHDRAAALKMTATASINRQIQIHSERGTFPVPHPPWEGPSTLQHPQFH